MSCMCVRGASPLIGLVLMTGMMHGVSGSEAVQSPTTETPVVETPQVVSQAALWSIDSEAYQRYLTLMDGPLGKWNPNIDPILALGMYADTPAEQDHYATLYARQEFVLTTRALRFQRAYRAAFSHLFPDQPIADPQWLAPYRAHHTRQPDNDPFLGPKQDALMAGDRLLLFVPSRCEPCHSLIQRVMGWVAAVADGGLDVFVLQANDDAAVRRWAQAHHMPPRWLQSGDLRLNRDEGLFKRLREHQVTRTGESGPPPTGQAPVLYLQRNAAYFQLSLEDLQL